MSDRRPVLACRPVVWPLPGVKEAPVDPAWVKGNCEACGCEVYLAEGDVAVAAAAGAAIACGTAVCVSSF